MSNAIQHIKEKLKRADEHIAQLHQEVDAFLDQAPPRTLIDYELQAGEQFKDFHQKRTVPPRLSVLTGEVLYQLRSSLDHLLCALVLQDGGVLTSKTQFPIFTVRPTDKKDLRRYAEQIAGVTRPEVLAELQRRQPYDRGSGIVWLSTLKTLSNNDKHRALTLHIVYPEPRVKALRATQPGRFMEVDRPDDGTRPVPTDIDVQRRITTVIAFADWVNAAGRQVEIVHGLRNLFEGVTSAVNAFAQYLP